MTLARSESFITFFFKLLIGDKFPTFSNIWLSLDNWRGVKIEDHIQNWAPPVIPKNPWYSECRNFSRWAEIQRFTSPRTKVAVTRLLCINQGWENSALEVGTAHDLNSYFWGLLASSAPKTPDGCIHPSIPAKMRRRLLGEMGWGEGVEGGAAGGCCSTQRGVKWGVQHHLPIPPLALCTQPRAQAQLKPNQGKVNSPFPPIKGRAADPAVEWHHTCRMCLTHTGFV